MGSKNTEGVDARGLVSGLRAQAELESWFAPDFFIAKKKEQKAPDHNLSAGKRAEVDALFHRVKACDLCPLSKTKTNTVFGEGNIDADLMFVGEAPGRDEDLAGRPFVGAAGQLLTKIIEAMGRNRKDVYITNVLRCRPPHNRNPLPEEIACCRPYLNELIRLIRPKIICSLGKFAASVMLDRTVPITRVRGQFFDLEDGIKLMPTFHPAYLLRNPADKKLVWSDIKKIMSYLRS